MCQWILRHILLQAHPRSKEVDLVVCNQNKAEELIQVAYDIDSDKTFSRETNSLLKASIALNCDNLTLIAFSETRDVEIGGIPYYLDKLRNDQTTTENIDRIFLHPQAPNRYNIHTIFTSKCIVASTN